MADKIITELPEQLGPPSLDDVLLMSTDEESLKLKVGTLAQAIGACAAIVSGSESVGYHSDKNASTLHSALLANRAVFAVCGTNVYWPIGGSSSAMQFGRTTASGTSLTQETLHIFSDAGAVIVKTNVSSGGSGGSGRFDSVISSIPTVSSHTVSEIYAAYQAGDICTLITPVDETLHLVGVSATEAQFAGIRAGDNGAFLLSIAFVYDTNRVLARTLDLTNCQKLTVTITPSGGYYSTSHSSSQISAAYQAGRVVEATYNGTIYHLLNASSSGASFTSVNITGSDIVVSKINIIGTDALLSSGSISIS